MHQFSRAAEECEATAAFGRAYHRICAHAWPVGGQYHQGSLGRSRLPVRLVVARRANPWLKVTLFTALGLLTSIGVAWHACLWGQWRSPGVNIAYVVDDGLTWICHVEGNRSSLTFETWTRKAGEPDAWGFTRPARANTVDIYNHEERGFQKSLAASPHWIRYLPPGTVVQRVAAGWPMACVEGECVTTYGLADQSSPTRQYSWLLPAEDALGSSFRYQFIPFRPLWLGMACDAGMYGALLWFLASVPMFSRSLLKSTRHTPGTCKKCKYDLRDLPLGTPCPECGTPAPASRVA